MTISNPQGKTEGGATIEPVADTRATPERAAVEHTPGPWMVARAILGVRVISNATHDTICGVGEECNSAWTISDEATAEANARLIAAAPKLLRALRDLLDQVESLDDFTLTRDVEPYEAEANWDDAIRYAKLALADGATNRQAPAQAKPLG